MLVLGPVNCAMLHPPAFMLSKPLYKIILSSYSLHLVLCYIMVAAGHCGGGKQDIELCG